MSSPAPSTVLQPVRAATEMPATASARKSLRMFSKSEIEALLIGDFSMLFRCDEHPGAAYKVPLNCGMSPVAALAAAGPPREAIPSEAAPKEAILRAIYSSTVRSAGRRLGKE